MEYWKDIQETDGCYQVSNLGRVKGLARTVTAGWAIQNLPERPVKIRKYKNKYPSVVLKGKTREIHRIMAIHFIPNPNNYKCVNHKNGNKEDWSLDNLEWCTHSYNTIHAYKTGIIKLKVSKEQADYIVNSGKNIYHLAAELGISKSQVWNIRTGKNISYL